jgi:cytochrome b
VTSRPARIASSVLVSLGLIWLLPGMLKVLIVPILVMYVFWSGQAERGNPLSSLLSVAISFSIAALFISGIILALSQSDIMASGVSDYAVAMVDEFGDVGEAHERQFKATDRSLQYVSQRAWMDLLAIAVVVISSVLSVSTFVHSRMKG